MPYIPEEERPKIATTIPTGLTVGHVAFILCDVVDQWIGELPNYERLNAAIGVLECSKLEVARRILARYEDQKITANGDVFMERE